MTEWLYLPKGGPVHQVEGRAARALCGVEVCGWSESAEYDVSEGPKTTESGGRIDQWGGVTPC